MYAQRASKEPMPRELLLGRTRLPLGNRLVTSTGARRDSSQRARKRRLRGVCVQTPGSGYWAGVVVPPPSVLFLSSSCFYGSACLYDRFCFYDRLCFYDRSSFLLLEAVLPLPLGREMPSRSLDVVSSQVVAHSVSLQADYILDTDLLKKDIETFKEKLDNFHNISSHKGFASIVFGVENGDICSQLLLQKKLTIFGQEVYLAEYYAAALLRLPLIL